MRCSWGDRIFPWIEWHLLWKLTNNATISIFYDAITNKGARCTDLLKPFCPVSSDRYPRRCYHLLLINLSKFGWKFSQHILHKKKCHDLNLGESIYIFTFFLFPGSGLNLLNDSDFFYFERFWMAWHWKPPMEWCTADANREKSEFEFKETKEKKERPQPCPSVFLTLSTISTDYSSGAPRISSLRTMFEHFYS